MSTNIERLTDVRNRLAAQMGWNTREWHRFEVVRRTMNAQALAISVEKAEELADRIDQLERTCAENSIECK